MEIFINEFASQDEFFEHSNIPETFFRVVHYEGPRNWAY